MVDCSAHDPGICSHSDGSSGEHMSLDDALDGESGNKNPEDMFRSMMSLLPTEVMRVLVATKINSAFGSPLASR